MPSCVLEFPCPPYFDALFLEVSRPRLSRPQLLFWQFTRKIGRHSPNHPRFLPQLPLKLVKFYTIFTVTSFNIFYQHMQTVNTNRLSVVGCTFWLRVYKLDPHTQFISQLYYHILFYKLRNFLQKYDLTKHEHIFCLKTYTLFLTIVSARVDWRTETDGLVRTTAPCQVSTAQFSGRLHGRPCRCLPFLRRCPPRDRACMPCSPLCARSQIMQAYWLE